MTTRILDANDEIFINAPGQVRIPAARCNGAPSCARAVRMTPTANFTSRRSSRTRSSSSSSSTNFFRARSASAPARSNDALRRISGCKEEHFTNQAEKLAGRLVAELNYSALEDIKTVGMHQYMDELQIKLNAIGEAIFQTYLFFPPPFAPEPDAPSRQGKSTRARIRPRAAPDAQAKAVPNPAHPQARESQLTVSCVAVEREACLSGDGASWSFEFRRDRNHKAVHFELLLGEPYAVEGSGQRLFWSYPFRQSRLRCTIESVLVAFSSCRSHYTSHR